MDTFEPGMQVEFSTEEGPIRGEVIRVNPKTVSIRPDGEDDGYYRVPHHMVRAVDRDGHAGAHGRRLLHQITQDELRHAMSPLIDARLERIMDGLAPVLASPDGELVVAVSRSEIDNGMIHGFVALALLMKHRGLGLSMAGRIHLVTIGYEKEPRPLFQVPEVRDWLRGLQSRLPWLACWLSPSSRVAFQLISAISPPDIVHGRPHRTKEMLDAALAVATWGVAFTRRLGGTRIDHVLAMLAIFGVEDLPDGFFGDLSAQESMLDEVGVVGMND